MRIPQNWRLSPIGMTLTGEKCGSCGKVIFPPRDLCPECGERVLPEGVSLAEEIREGRTSPPKISYGGKERGG